MRANRAIDGPYHGVLSATIKYSVPGTLGLVPEAKLGADSTSRDDCDTSPASDSGEYQLANIIHHSGIDEALFDAIESSPRANIQRSISTALAIEPIQTRWGAASINFRQRFTELQVAAILVGIARTAYMIEPVNRDITSTKFAARWSPNTPSYFGFGGAADPRGASFAECDQIADDLIAELTASLGDPLRVSTLQLAIDHRIISHEIPVDYVDSSPTVQRIHVLGNVAWAWDGVTEKTIRLRSWLFDQGAAQLPFMASTLGEVMTKVVKDKVKIKTYLTDRAQTGPYQTNREKRWEAHPASVQFASRRSAWAIEHELLEQACFFQGFPLAVTAAAQQAGLIQARPMSRCPITLDPLDFPAFATEVVSPSHGRSNFQVGHLNPLKTTVRTAGSAGHTAENISWISAAGNRIQGDLSLNGARQLINHIADNYRLLL
jgi:hypothetical protein